MKTHLRIPLISLVTVAIALLSACGAEEQLPPEQPNFVIILADDQGWGDLSLHGNTNIATPQIDSIAEQGAMFDQFYVCRVCAPTRAEFLTGRYHARGGVRGVSRGEERLNVDETTIADTFKAAGYATGAFGKWHNGTQHPYHPNARGFDEYYGFCSGHWGDYFSPVLEHNGKFVRGNGFIIDDLTDHALQFIQQNKDQPFFCYLPYNTPHSPMQVPDRFYEKFDGLELGMLHRDPEREDVPKTRAALAMVENIDWNVGRILTSLDEMQLAENTVVIYFSDNGPNSYRWNGDMKGRKGSIDEGGLRVPFLIRWPGKIQPGTKVSQIAGAIDLLPTLADLAGVPLIGEKPLDGRSIKPLLLGEAKDWPDRMIFSIRPGANEVSVRNQNYRLDAEGKLYDIDADRGQRTDVAADHPEVANRLKQAAKQWAAEVIPHIGQEDRPFTVGYSASTPLPARDGISHGAIERSARAPNCSYFTNWTSLEDEITWDIEVAEDGDYEADIYYTCAPGDVGSTVELLYGENGVSGKLTEAHDPPAVGAEHDRVPRLGESLVKDFKPFRLGVLPMEKGAGTLTLRAVEIAGEQVMEVRGVMLTRKQ